MHKATHSAEKPYSCKDCGKKYKTRLGLRFHESKHKGEKPHECKECGRCFYSSVELKAHMDTHKQEKLSCTDCGYQTKSKNCLNSHLKKHEAGEMYTCDECGKQHSSKTHLNSHKRRTHNKTLAYQCSICGEKGFTKIGLKIT